MENIISNKHIATYLYNFLIYDEPKELSLTTNYHSITDLNFIDLVQK